MKRLSDTKAYLEKKKEMTLHFLFLECRVIILKILENSINSAMDIKAGPVPEEKSFDLRERVGSSWQRIDFKRNS